MNDSISLTLSKKESQFLAWSQAFVCAVIKRNEAMTNRAGEMVRRFAHELGAEGINSLGDRHALLARAAWPDMVTEEFKVDEALPPPPGVSQ